MKAENKLWGVIKDSRREKPARLSSGSEAPCMPHHSGPQAQDRHLSASVEPGSCQCCEELALRACGSSAIPSLSPGEHGLQALVAL